MYKKTGPEKSGPVFCASKDAHNYFYPRVDCST
nr:MAG TPA: hypothetical protein [Caudoviricetes sp.]